MPNAGTLRESASRTCRQLRPGLDGPIGRREKTGTKVRHHSKVLKSSPFLGFRIRLTFRIGEYERPEMDQNKYDNDVMDDGEDKTAAAADTDNTVMDDDEDKTAAAADCGKKIIAQLCNQSY